ncbi:hypothetical protein GWI33_000818 [Rhynchophorus ferrugineus]|uniref:Uncharacterized protein n=1 Tax=Rhynchophorus ferrugineus TaxID=354439 RepID=A0A834HNI9_RHYFE|nr:hypothetical protein GWI33_000823 [Rhynchophorus ferrugineus]KAF7263962.1 hypothetical protein GWI33_000818 [Rhynchophorus ferrugineus]
MRPDNIVIDLYDRRMQNSDRMTNCVHRRAIISDSPCSISSPLVPLFANNSDGAEEISVPCPYLCDSLCLRAHHPRGGRVNTPRTQKDQDDVNEGESAAAVKCPGHSLPAGTHADIANLGDVPTSSDQFRELPPDLWRE